MERVRFIDGDAHILEPQDIWDEYLEKKYKGAVGKGFARWAHASTLADGEARLQEKGQDDPLCFNMEIEVMGRQVPNRAPRDPRVGVDGKPLVQGTDTDQAFGSTANAETGVTIIEDRELNDLTDAYGKWADGELPGPSVPGGNGHPRHRLHDPVPHSRLLGHRSPGDGRRDGYCNPEGLKPLAGRLHQGHREWSMRSRIH